MKLVDNWDKAHRMLSVRAMTLGAALQVVWMNLPPDLKAALPSNWVQWVSLTIMLLGVAGRLVHQPGVDDAGFPDTQPVDKA